MRGICSSGRFLKITQPMPMPNSRNQHRDQRQQTLRTNLLRRMSVCGACGCRSFQRVDRRRTVELLRFRRQPLHLIGGMRAVSVGHACRNLADHRLKRVLDVIVRMVAEQGTERVRHTDESTDSRKHCQHNQRNGHDPGRFVRPMDRVVGRDAASPSSW